MISLTDLQLPTRRPAAPAPTGTEAGPVDPVEAGSPLARVLFQIVSGTPVVVVPSPPGAGKSTLIAELVRHLVVKESPFASMNLSVHVCAPTKAACIELAKRMAARTGDGDIALSGTAFKTVYVSGVSSWSDQRINKYTSPVQISTVASARMSKPRASVMIFDEAYQSTYADAVAAAENAAQVVFVGDPGQIGPVNALDISPWSHLEVSPHMRAPEGFVGREDTAVVTLPSSYRLGPETVAAIGPLYDFEFDSKRPNAVVDGFAELESVVLPRLNRVAHPRMVNAVLDRVTALCRSTVVADTGRHSLSAEDVAVVVARNEQRAHIAAVLAANGLADVTVGTANSLQGGQWMAVVAVDPFLGTQTGSSHAAELGRLCVMVSRHVAHLTWVCSQDWPDVIAGAELDSEVADRHVQVRRRLLAVPHQYVKEATA